MKNVQYSLKSKIMYGLGDVFGGGAFLIVSLLFLNYLTDVELISPALAGIIIMSGKIVDAITDPIMGYISDRTRSKFGRRRVYFLLGALPVFISFSLLWYSFNISGRISIFIYYFITYILFSLAFTLVMIPYNSILPEMVNDYNERTSFTTVRLIFSVSAAILSGILPSIIIGAFDNIKIGYLIMGIIFAALFSIPWLFVFGGTTERMDTVEENNVNFFEEIKYVFKNKVLRIQMGIFITSQSAVDILTALFIYYLTVCLNREKEFSAILGTLLVVQLIGMPISAKISNKYGKIKPLFIGFFIWILALIGAFIINADSAKFLIYIIAGTCGIGTAVATFVPISILPELADVDELITGKRREGIYSGIITFIRKAANGLVIGIIGLALQLIGYLKPEVAGQAMVQSSQVIYGVKLLFVIAPILFIIISLIFAKAYKLTEEKHKIIMKEIERIKGNNKAKGDKKTQKVCEEITGYSYSKLKALRADFGNLA